MAIYFLNLVMPWSNPHRIHINLICNGGSKDRRLLPVLITFLLVFASDFLCVVDFNIIFTNRWYFLCSFYLIVKVSVLALTTRLFL